MGINSSKDGTSEDSGIASDIAIPSRQRQNYSEQRRVNNNNNNNNSNNVISASTEDSNELQLDGDLYSVVPTVFKWEHGGRNVYITGTFNNWERQIPMHRSGNDFSYVHNLKRGKHAYKFIVDDEWRFAPDQPTVTILLLYSILGHFSFR